MLTLADGITVAVADRPSARLAGLAGMRRPAAAHRPADPGLPLGAHVRHALRARPDLARRRRPASSTSSASVPPGADRAAALRARRRRVARPAPAPRSSRRSRPRTPGSIPTTPTSCSSRTLSAVSARSSLTFSSSDRRASSQRSTASRSRRASRPRATAASALAAVGREHRVVGALGHAQQVAERQRGQLEPEVEHLGARAAAVALRHLLELALERLALAALRLELEPPLAPRRRRAPRPPSRRSSARTSSGRHGSSASASRPSPASIART